MAGAAGNPLMPEQSRPKPPWAKRLPWHICAFGGDPLGPGGVSVPRRDDGRASRVLPLRRWRVDVRGPGRGAP